MISADDIIAIGFLVILEGVLSIDNALVLALLVKHLPNKEHKRALTYGLAGAVVFRVMAISAAAYLMKWTWVKFVGGAYLIYLAANYWWANSKDEKSTKDGKERNFWMTVLVVELTDIAFAIDSILTAVALTKKVWVVLTGGILGLVMMRFAASIFISLLEKFPRFEGTAYALVFLIGGKLIIDGFHYNSIDFHSPSNPAFWAFWVSMTTILSFGFSKRR
jgi:YkoY family integral membrane protein